MVLKYIENCALLDMPLFNTPNISSNDNSTVSEKEKMQFILE